MDVRLGPAGPRVVNGRIDLALIKVRVEVEKYLSDRTTDQRQAHRSYPIKRAFGFPTAVDGSTPGPVPGSSRASRRASRLRTASAGRGSSRSPGAILQTPGCPCRVSHANFAVSGWRPGRPEKLEAHPPP